MKLVNIEQRAKLQIRLEVAAAAVLSTVIVSTLVLLSTPGYMAAARQMVLA